MGLQCPGPILKLKTEMDKLSPGGRLRETASDPGFASDVASWAKMTGNTLVELTHEKGKITAVSFSGARGCSTVGVAGLPWAFTATGASSATITNADFISKGGPCGPANMPLSLSSGVIGYNAAFDQCSHVGFSLTTQPTLTITP